MGEQSTFQGDTVLYSADAPEGRVFAAGEADPGKGWFDHPAKVEKAAPTAQKGQQGAGGSEALKKANEENADLRGQIASLTEDLRVAKEKIAEQVGELTSREGVILDLRDQVAEQAALIAKFDPDGDGKPGGSAPKAKE